MYISKAKVTAAVVVMVVMVTAVVVLGVMTKRALSQSSPGVICLGDRQHSNASQRVSPRDATQCTRGVTFDVKKDANSSDMDPGRFLDYLDYLYELQPVQEKKGKILVMTEPEGEHVISSLGHGLLDAVFYAYSEHRHLVLRPDDIWLALTTAFGLYVNKHAEEMREHFVTFEGKKKLKVEVGGTMRSVDWNYVLGLMSDLIEENTNAGVRDWLEPDFSTTQPVSKTVGRIAMMSALQKYFTYTVMITCGIPKVTLQGTLEDWVKLRTKAAHLKSFNVQCLTHWADLLDPILAKLIESYQGKVDEAFWGHIITKRDWGSGPVFFEGWATVFVPFDLESGRYILSGAAPERNKWGRIDMNDIPAAATVEVPVTIVDNGRVYNTVFIGGHLVTIYDPAEDSVRPSIDWLIMDITEEGDHQTSSNERPDPVRFHERPDPVRFHYTA